MKRGLRGLISSLSVRLLVYLLPTMAAVFVVYGFVAHHTTSDRWTETINAYATRTGELVKRATRYGMLLNRKEDVHQIIRFVAQTPGVAGIRIYDKQGVIVFSADDEETGRVVDLKAEACVICHDQAEPLHSPPLSSRVRVYSAPVTGERLMGVIDPIANTPECSNAACHAHPPEQSVLGVLDVRMSMAAVDDAVASTRNQWVLLTVVMLLLVGAATVVLVVRMVRRPVLALWEGTRLVAQGNLTTRIDVDSPDELGALARAFNRMTADLQAARTELEGWSHKLEDEVEQKTEELGQIQRQIVQMEKMASLGKLSATVAHEINNPLAGVLNYAKLVDRTLRDDPTPEDMAEVRRWLSVIQKETMRCGDIVRNLLVFARQSGKRLARINVREVVDRALLLVNHHAEMAGSTIQSSLDVEDDVVECDGDQIQQALLALVMNGIEAMRGRKGGVLRVAMSGDADTLQIDVSDTGCGIPEGVLPHIFEPFYSTKNQESGVGLGLAVVYGIVHRHGGEITVDTVPGEGTTFHLRLPRRPPAQSEVHAEA